jgi:hypothetical protein
MKHYTLGEDDKLIIDVPTMAKNVSLFIATPAYGRVTSEYTASLVRLIQFLNGKGIRAKIHWHRGSSACDLARCMCVAEFLSSGMTHMLFIDDDLHWIENEVIRMLAMDLPVYGGTYPKKYLFWDNIIKAAKDGRFDDLVTAGVQMTHKVLEGGKTGYGYAEAERLPGGFLLMQRWVFEQIIDKRPDLKFKINDTDKINEWMYAFFQHTLDLKAGTWNGEDYYFCDLCRSCGIDVYVDTLNRITHIGSYAYTGDPAAPTP